MFDAFLFILSFKKLIYLVAVTHC